jgi:nucleoside-diphosphate-sugar epimerase
MIYIVGGNGFVGSAYARYCVRRGLTHTVITRANAEALRGSACDLLINANGNSRKMLADREPLDEFRQSVVSVAETLSFFQAKSYVLLSSGDVYPDTSRPETSGEDQTILPGSTSRYGLHKRLAEELVRGCHPDWLVVRMGGFVGPGIKKNAIFDILTGGPVWLSPESQLQFINTDHAAEVVMGLIGKSVRREIVNLGGEGVIRLGDFHAHTNSKAAFNPGAPTVRFELSLEKLKRLAGPLPGTVEDVMAFAAAWPASGVPA